MPWPVVVLVFRTFELLTFSDVDDKESNSTSMEEGDSARKSRMALDDSKCPSRSGDTICDHDLRTSEAKKRTSSGHRENDGTRRRSRRFDRIDDKV